MNTLLQDLRFGLRMLARNPGFTAVAVLTLALGIGANTTIFSLINTVMLRVLPVVKPQELAQIHIRNPQGGDDARTSFTNALWEQLRGQQDVFSGIFSWSEDPFDLAQGGAVQYVNGIWVSGDFFKTLGLRPAAGRLITASDDQRGCPGVAVLSHGFWQDHYGGAESALGSTLPLNGHLFQVIGVAPPGFYGVNLGSKFDVALPHCATAIFDGKTPRLEARSWWWLSIIGRVKPGITPEQVKARLAALSPQISAAAVPQDWEPKDQQRFLKMTFVPYPAAAGTSYLRQQFREPLDILMAVVGLVLLIACANVASFMLARATTRNKEFAVRRALGASRARLTRQLLTECVLLSSAGALLGILFANWGSALLVHYISTGHNKILLDLYLDGRVLGFTAAIAVLTAILFGVLPAIRSTRVSLTAAMKGSQAVEGKRQVRLRPAKWIVAGQVALSLVLLVVAGLFLRSFTKLVTLDIGFDRNNVLLINANLKAGNVPPKQRLATFEEIESRLRSLPGVISASRSFTTPISGFEWNNFVQADSPNAPTGEDSLAYFNFISPGYFQTLRTPLLAGREFDAHDVKTAPKVAIVNQTLARKFFPNVNPIGRYLRTQQGPGQAAPPIQIVGLVKDSKYESLHEDTFPQVFFPAAQAPGDSMDDAENFELRTATRPSALARTVQDAVAGVNKAIPLEFHTLAEQVDDSLVQERVLAMLSGFFGALALLLAMIGLYGTFSYLVTQRQAEFGLRMALGAQRSSILWLVMRDVAAILAGGVVAGLLVSLAVVNLLQKLLFGLGARDTVTLTLATVVLAVVVILAGYIPARRATKVDPMVALRYE